MASPEGVAPLCVSGFFGNLLKFDPIKVQQEILRDYMSARGSSARASDFTGSTFAEAKFVGVDLAFVLFDASRFEMARFRHAVFDGADFSGANLSSIVVDSDTKLPTAAPKSPLK